jgi:hypothetical protein
MGRMSRRAKASEVGKIETEDGRIMVAAIRSGRISITVQEGDAVKEPSSTVWLSESQVGELQRMLNAGIGEAHELGEFNA